MATDIEADLQRHRNPLRAVAEKAYLKSDLGFIGVGLPTMRQLVRSITGQYPFDRRDLLELVQRLWREPVFESRMTAILLLARLEALLRPADIRLLERLIRESKTWAFVDELAIAVIAPLVERHAAIARVLDRWSRDDNFWVRRSSLLALLPLLRHGSGDFPRFARYADSMLAEREFFIRKAIGWVLRETGKRRPDVVYGWLHPRARRASGVTVAEAVKYLSPAQRDAVLAAYRSEKRLARASGRGPR